MANARVSLKVLQAQQNGVTVIIALNGLAPKSLAASTSEGQALLACFYSCNIYGTQKLCAIKLKWFCQGSLNRRNNAIKDIPIISSGIIIGSMASCSTAPIALYVIFDAEVTHLAPYHAYCAKYCKHSRYKYAPKRHFKRGFKLCAKARYGAQ